MSFPLPHASVPVVDPRTGLMTGPWLLYFAKEQVAGSSVDPVNGSSATASARAAGAETIALQAIGRHIQQQAGLPVAGIPSRPAFPPDAIMPAIPTGRREWSVFTLIPVTAAVFTADYSAIPSAWPSALVIETDTFVLRWSDGAAWTELLLPGLAKFLGSTAAFPALLRSGAKLQVVTADNGGLSDLEVLDDPFGAGWNANIEVPTKNAVYDEMQSTLALIAAFNPQVTTTVALTAQTATVGPTTMASSGTQWVFKYALLITTTDAGAATVTVSVNYTDAIGATSQAGAALAVTANNRQTGQFIIQRASGNVTYTVTVTGAIGTADFAFYATLQRQA